MASMMPAIDPAKPAKKMRKYQAVRDWLAERIAQGEYGRGAQLPSEHDLMARFEVSRVTARQALDDLRRLGIVESRRGKGHFVSRLTAVHSLERLQSFGEMMAPLGVATHSNIIELLETPATKEVAAWVLGRRAED
jgi:GntR family transcriptional regulator